MPEGLYPGDYLKPVGAALAREFGPALKDKPETEWLPAARKRAIDAMMAMIRDDLAALNIAHEVFASERALTGADGGEDRVREAIDWLRARGLVYQGRLPPPKGAPSDDWEDREQTLFRSTDFGDDVDRPLIKSDGSYTYFAGDIAYHKTKIDRGYRTLVDVWGADHGGYVKRMQAAVAALSERQGQSRGAALPARASHAGRRAGQNVETFRGVRDPSRGRGRGRRGRCPVHDADAQERRAARFRPGEGDRAKPGQPGLLRAIRARPRPQRSKAGQSRFSRL